MPQHAQAFERAIQKTVGCPYLLFLPEGHAEAERPCPLTLFLHGAGERGSDLELVKKHGPPRIVEQRPDFPFILVSPQCRAGEEWDVDTLDALLDEVVGEWSVDESRVYLTGLSMGGSGTWRLACARPDRFAAIAPICGRGRPLLAHKLADVPVWCFQGARDDVVPVSESERMVEAVNEAGGSARLTVYPDAGHDAWTRTYENPELYEWFLGHRIA
ncbi:MAG: prolyl oligopeptidase family serine peptidase [Planctomycetota bacterium]